MNKKMRKNIGTFLISISSVLALFCSGGEAEAAKRKDYSINSENIAGDQTTENGENQSEDNVRTYIEKIDEAGEFRDGIAEIKFWVGDMSYRGFVDVGGKMKFYIPLESGNYYENTGLDQGYITHFINDTLYVLSSEGEVLSHYDKNQVICYGAGYTWVKEDSSNDWNDAGTCKYILYAPTGEEVQDAGFSVSNDQNFWESFKYLGDGVFYYQTMEDEINDTFCFYFTGTAQKKQYNTSFMQNRDEQFQNGYIVDCYRDENETCHIELMSNQGEYQDIVIPQECSTEDYTNWYIHGITEKYVLMSDSTGTLVVYDINNSSFQRYTGQYADSLDCDYTGLQGNVIAVRIYGKNDKIYVGLINVDTMTEIGEPIETNDFSLAQEVLVVYGDDEKVIYDLNGNKEFTCDYYADVYSAGEGATIIDDDSGYHYAKSDGSEFFPDGIDYDNARNLDADLRKQAIG